VRAGYEKLSFEQARGPSRSSKSGGSSDGRSWSRNSAVLCGGGAVKALERDVLGGVDLADDKETANGSNRIGAMRLEQQQCTATTPFNG
jgi:hypothetical protein